MPPHLLSINPSEEWREWKHHCSDSEHIFADESELSSQMAVPESENNGLRNNRTRCLLPLFMLMWALAGRRRTLLWEPIQFWTQCYFLKPDRITFVHECPFSTMSCTSTFPISPLSCTGFAQSWMVRLNQFSRHSQTLSFMHLASAFLARWW